MTNKFFVLRVYLLCVFVVGVCVHMLVCRMALERSRVVSREEGVSNREPAQENDMLDMTLNMLRCSVCKDRFKEVAITRCFHLFCKECIEENLRNRSRKCPACGEKFGQDDVKQVYFTH